MAPVISLLIILALSILITRVATVALVLTGLSRDSSRFQARSAFLGVGFTTSESEKAVDHPIRRKILLALMLLGNAGIITALSSLILTFVNFEGPGRSVMIKVLPLVAGLVLLWIAGTSSRVDRHLSNIIGWALKRYTRLEAQGLADLLNLAGDYRVNEIIVNPGGWMANRDLSELKLKDEGVIVLGITREDGQYLGAPSGQTKIMPRDKLVVYGRSSALERLVRRTRGKQGDIEHERACIEQGEVSRREKEEGKGKQAR